MCSKMKEDQSRGVLKCNSVKILDFKDLNIVILLK